VSISKMQRVAVIGLDTEKERLMSMLSDFGAVELTDQSEKLEDEEWKASAVQDENQEAVAALENKMNRAQAVLDLIEKYDTSKSPLFSTRRKISFAGFKSLQKDSSDVEETVQMFLDLGDEIHILNDKINRLDTDILSMVPWVAYGLPVELNETKDCNIHKGVLPADCDLSLLGQTLETDFDEAVFKVIRKEKELTYAALICTKDSDEEVMNLMRDKGFTESVFKDIKGTPSEAIDRMKQEYAVYLKETAKLEGEIAEKAHLKAKVEEYYDALSMNAEKEKNRSKLLKTAQTFFMEGWIPERFMEDAKKILDDAGCYYVFRDPLEEENVPVILENSSIVTPFESVTEMYSLPSYHGFDPTKIFAGFYVVFFGIMLSDAGYGIIMTLACWLILKKYDLEGMARKLIQLFMYCGMSTVFWGAMFGGWFGDIVAVVSRIFFENEIIIKPLWFNPMDDPIKLLIFSIAMGIVHLFTGLGIKAYMQIREGKWFDAICDEGFWILTITGICGWLGGSMIMPALTDIGMWMAIVGVAGLLLTGGRHNKGIGKIVGGLSSVYDITSYLSDILSYSRILALGLATGVIAQVVNTMGSIFGGGVIGAILLLIIFLLGHTLNIAINVLGAYVHTCRLQYVEFFGKFYIDGGEPFEPMGQKTKYVKVIKDK